MPDRRAESIPPQALYNAAEVRALEQILIRELGVSGYDLMQRAAAAVFQHATTWLPETAQVLVLTGPGNNGGDGYVVAKLLLESGYGVSVLSLCDPLQLKGDAATAYDDWSRWGETLRFQGELPAGCDLLIDAMLGTGLQRPLQGEFLQAVQLANAYPAPRLAVDIPSGLGSDSGSVMGAAIRAAETVTFIGEKRGLHTGAAADYAGRITLHSLGTPAAVYAQVAAKAHLDRPHQLGHWLTSRRADSNKGLFGHSLLIGGQTGMSGAIRLAAEAAARSGSGLVSVATAASHAALIGAARPELMAHGIDRAHDLASVLERASVVGIGPGLGQSAWAKALWQAALHSGKPLVVDADALNLLAQEPQRCHHWILTPHPGEAARLLGCDTATIQADRYTAVQQLQQQYGGVAVLKGKGTLIASEGGEVFVCGAGNPGMASGGMGDVLTGVITAMLAQGLAPCDAARAGVLAHSYAADLAAQHQPRGLLASDLFATLRQAVNPL